MQLGKGDEAMNVKTVTVYLVVFGALVSAPLLWGQDIVKVAPKNCKVLLDNDKVRVVRVTLKPGEKLEMHSHPANIVYSLNSAKAKYTYADGKRKSGTSRPVKQFGLTL